MINYKEAKKILIRSKIKIKDFKDLEINKYEIDPLYPFLINIYENENKYHFLEKVFDTEQNNYQKFHTKIFKINYETFYDTP